jgi:hypothetical protein
VLHDALKDASRGSTGRRTWVRNALVVSEVAFACVLLVGAGLLLRSFDQVLDVDLGFRPADAITMRVDPDAQYARARSGGLLRRGAAPRRATARRGGAGITDALPLGRNRTWGARAKGVTYERGSSRRRFRDRQRRLLRGDGHSRSRPAATSRRRTRRRANRSSSSTRRWRGLWPGRIRSASRAQRVRRRSAVVGVVGDVRHLALEQASGNEMYIPLRQCGDLPSTIWSSARSDGAAGRARCATTLQPLAPNLAGNDVRTIQQLVDARSRRGASSVLMLGGFAAFALILASLGIYALISYSVNQRTQEIGIRMALGASARDVQARIVLQTLRLAAIGCDRRRSRRGRWRSRSSGLLFGVTATRSRSRSSRCCRPDDRRHAGRLPAGPPRVTDRSAGGPSSGVVTRGQNDSVVAPVSSVTRRQPATTATPRGNRRADGNGCAAADACEDPSAFISSQGWRFAVAMCAAGVAAQVPPAHDEPLRVDRLGARSRTRDVPLHLLSLHRPTPRPGWGYGTGPAAPSENAQPSEAFRKRFAGPRRPGSRGPAAPDRTGGGRQRQREPSARPGSVEGQARSSTERGESPDGSASRSARSSRRLHSARLHVQPRHRVSRRTPRRRRTGFHAGATRGDKHAMVALGLLYRRGTRRRTGLGRRGSLVEAGGGRGACRLRRAFSATRTPAASASSRITNAPPPSTAGPRTRAR